MKYWSQDLIFLRSSALRFGIVGSAEFDGSIVAHLSAQSSSVFS